MTAKSKQSIPSFLRLLTSTLLLLAVLTLASHPAHAQTWNLAWSDEFNGNSIDTSKWQFDHGDLQVNNELEWYCGPPLDPANQIPCGVNPNGAPNVLVDGSGHLIIQAFRITSDTAPSSKAWTSSRLNTANNLASFQYGRIEARIQLPVGPGIWPAFWALGTNIGTVGWPNSGEIDYMENVPLVGNLGPGKVRSTLHGPTYNGANGLGHDYAFPANDPNGPDVTSYHIYGAIWSPSLVQFYVDDPANVFFVRTASDVPGGTSQWAFDHPFFLLLNLAVGGTGSWPGPPDSTTPSPAQMVVDYVRAYTPAQVTGPTMSGSAITVKAGASGSSTVNLTSASGSGLVYLECSGAPSKATCAIDSGNALNSHIVDFRSTGSATATVNVTTTASTGRAVPFSDRNLWAAVGGFSVVFGVMLFPLSVRRRGLQRSAATGVMLLAIAFVPSCGGGGSSGGGGGGGGTTGTPTGNYNLTVKATTVSGDTSTATLGLTVN